MMKQLNKHLRIYTLAILLPLAVVSCAVAEQAAQQVAVQPATESPTKEDPKHKTEVERGHQRKVTAACFGPDGGPLSPCDVYFTTQNAHFSARCVTASSGICQTFIRCCGSQGSPPQLLWNVKATSVYGQANTSFWTSCGWTCDEPKYIRFTFSADKDTAGHRVEQSNVNPDRDVKALRGEIVPATQRTHCDRLTTKGKCWTGRNCKGTLTSSSTSCPNCRDSLRGKSFESLNTGHCYPTN